MTRRIDANQRTYSPCSRPTEHAPGSPEKLRVLTERWQRGEEFWHEDDEYRGVAQRWSLQTVRVESLIDATAERSRP